MLLPPTLLLAMLQRDRQAQISAAVTLSQAYAETADRARLDPLTGLRNRLAWEEALVAHVDDLEPIGLVLADVDGLKAANNAHGHETGDRLLLAVADQVRRAGGRTPGRSWRDSAATSSACSCPGPPPPGPWRSRACSGTAWGGPGRSTTSSW